MSEDAVCELCSFWKDAKCTHTFRLVFLVEPIGGQVEIQATPGMIPSELEDAFREYFTKLFSKIIPVIETMPLWDQIREFQLNHPDREHCPSRVESKELKPYLKLVKF